MPAVREVGAAEGIGEGLRPEEGRGLAAVGEGGPALRVHRGALLGRKPVDDVEEVRLDVGELVGADHSFEDVEAAAPVGVEDVRVERPVGEETDGAAVPEGEGAALAVREVRLEGGFFRAVVCPRRRLHHLACRSAHRAPPARTRVGHRPYLTVEPEFGWWGRGFPAHTDSHSLDARRGLEARAPRIFTRFAGRFVPLRAEKAPDGLPISVC